MKSTTVQSIAFAVLMALAVAGCGVRGSLDAPEAAKNADAADADSGQGKPEGASGKEHKPFILDGLLR